MDAPSPAYMTRLCNVRVVADCELPASLCFVTPPLSGAPDTVIVHKTCSCLSDAGAVSRVCILDDGDVASSEYKTVHCKGRSLKSFPVTFMCEFAWTSTRALRGLMLTQEACHAHPACPHIDSMRECILTIRKLVCNANLARVCTHCMQLTEEELDERMDVLFTTAHPSLLSTLPTLTS